MVEWIKADEFKQAFAETYDTQIHFDAQIVINATLPDLKDSIPVVPESYPGGLEEPGPCERWYGCINDLLFWMTYYYDLDREGVTIFTQSIRLSEERFLWSIVEKFIDLPKPIISNILWIRGHAENAKKSVYIKDKYGIVYEVYRAESNAEVKELLRFLKTLGSEYKYFSGESEDLNSDRIIIRKEPKKPDQIVGRYTIRSSAENSARLMSLRDNAIYEVKKENALEGISFSKGVIINNS